MWVIKLASKNVQIDNACDILRQTDRIDRQMCVLALKEKINVHVAHSPNTSNLNHKATINALPLMCSSVEVTTANV